MKLALVFCLLLTGCQIPRLFQSSVPAPVSASPSKVEAERAAADLIARKIESPVELKPVALSLSTSLGAPSKSLVDVKSFSLPSAASESDTALRAGILDTQKQLAALNLKLSRLQGKEIEGTGFSLLGPGISTIVIALVILGVIFPPAFTIMGLLYRRLKQTTSMVVEQIDEASKEPESQLAMKKVKTKLNGIMDTTNKRIIHSLQKP